MVIFTIIGIIVVIWFIVDHTGKSRYNDNSNRPKGSGTQYNKMAMAINGMIIILQEVENKINEFPPDDEFEKIEQQVVMIAYLSRLNIIDRLAKYNWNFNTPIIVPNISQTPVSLEKAYEMTVGHVQNLASDLGITDVVQGILGRNEEFTTFENSLPKEVRDKLNEGLL